MSTPSPAIASLACLVLLVGCTSEADRTVAAPILASHTDNFSPWSEPVSLGPTINTAFNDQQAALSKDALSLYFVSNRPGTPGPGPNNDIWVSQRACLECPWSDPVNLGAPINTGGNDAAPALSRDGHWLFFLSNRPGSASADIWVSYRENVHDDFGWGMPTNLGAGVNTAGFDGGPSYFENEGGAAQLYFNHNPLPVNTGGDLYVSEQAADGSFGPAMALVELNTPGGGQRPSIAHNGLAIYFMSNRPGSADVDIWFSTRESVLAPWRAPMNLGAPINTIAGELHPFIVKQGGTEFLYFTRNVATPPAQDFDLFVSARTRGDPQ